MTITSVNDGSSDKFYRAWADSADGSKGFSTTDSSKEYFGVYAGTTPPSNYKAYSWTKIKGEAGRSVTDTEMEYAINDSKTTPPTSGWSLEMPVWETGLYIWQRVKVSYSTGNPSYTTPHCLESNIIEDVTGNIGDWIFRDKTDVLSGTEIWTDKADEEALVHVEVDGKSYQHAGSGKNLFPSAPVMEGYYHSSAGLHTPSELSTLSLALVPVSKGKTYSWNNTQTAKIIIMTFNSNKEPLERILTYSGVTLSSTSFDDNVSFVQFSSYNANNYDFSDFQFEEGSVSTEYELPAPTPDYPIEIHSLNNVDVVSSVGKRNLWATNEAVGGFNTPIYESGYHDGGGLNHEMIMRPIPTKDKTKITFELWNPNRTVGSGTNRIAFLDSQKKPISFYNINLTGEPYQKQTFDINQATEFVRLGAIVGKDANSKDEDVRISFTFGDGVGRHILSPEDISENDNHPLIDKINLLLDEPLRSVGNVKDRLFRDSDGLWKVERNVGEYIINGTNSWTVGAPTGGWSTTGDTLPFYGALDYQRMGGAWSINSITSRFPTHPSTSGIVQSNMESFSLGYATFGIIIRIKKSRLTQETSVGFVNWLKENPINVVYELKTSKVEVLSQSLQDKLNNIASYANSNYVYTVLPDKSNILSENLKPTLHATFKSVAWANDFRYKFEQSKAMHSTDVWFAKGVSNTIAPNIGWSTDAPVWEDGLYIWSKTITTYGDGRTEETSPVCITGATGRSVSKIEEWYYLSNKSDSLEGGTWSKTPPTWKDGKYIWTKNKIIYKNPSGTEETLPINSTGGSGKKGETGTDARTVRLANVIHAVHFDQDGLMPSVSSIAFPTAVQGFSGVTPYYEFKMGDTIVRGLSTDSSWTLNTSAMEYSDFPLAVTVNVVIGGQTLATDTVTIVGTKPGEDAYTVVLANESHTFVGDVSNAIAGNTTANVIAYRGGTQVGATIGAISGMPAGMTSTIYSNGTTSARVTFTVTTSMKSPNGVVNIPVTVNGKSFTKVFNYAIAFKGAKGDKGTDGLAGKDGVGIKTTVLAYASSTSGTTTPTSGWATTVPTVAPGNYLWTRTTWTYTDNSVENGYTVSRIGKDGNTGKDGVAGKDGVGIKSTIIHYGKSTSGTSHSGVTWTTAVPSVPNGQFLWTRTTWTYDDNTTEAGYSVAKMGETGAKGATGPQGVSITKVDVQYYLSTSSTSLTGGVWSTTAPDWKDGRFMWSKTVTTYTSGSPTESKPVCITGAKGTTGSTGSTGATGRGISSIVEQFYLSDSKTTQTGGSWSATMPTWSPGKYVWTRSLITYTTGTPATSTTEPLVSSEWEAVNEIGVGGRNLLFNTDFKNSLDNWQIGTSYSASVDSSQSFNGNNSLKVIASTGNNTTGSSSRVYQWAWGNGQEELNPFVASVYVKADRAVRLGLRNGGNPSVEWFSVSTDWVKISSNYSGNKLLIWAEEPCTFWINSPKAEKGNIATDWSPAPEDVTASVKAAQDKANAASSSASTANSLLADIASDSKLTATEKKEAKKEWDIIVGEKPKIDSSADTYGITTQKTAYNTAYNALNTYLSSLLANLNTTSNIVGTTFRANFRTYYNARQDLLNKIADGAKSLVDEIEVGGTNLVRGSSVPIVITHRNTGSAEDNFNFKQIRASMKAGHTYTLSFDAQITHGSYSQVTIIPQYGHTSGSVYSIVNNKVIATFVATATTDSAITYIYAGVASATRGNGLIISNYKLEKGNKATDWSPAPEDLYQYVDDVDVGGSNLLPQSGNFLSSPNTFWQNNGGGIVYDENIKYGNYGTLRTNFPNGIRGSWITLENGIEYTYSALVKSSVRFTGGDRVPLHYHSGLNRVNQGKITIIKHDTSYEQSDVGKWKKLYITFKLIDDANSFNPFIYSTALTSSINIAYLKVEKGNKATDWSPAAEDVQSQIDKSVKSTDVEYYLSTSSTGLAGGSWQTTAPGWVNGRHMWSRTKVVLNDGSTSYRPNTTGTNITGAKGGTGATGRGVSSIVEQFYLSNSKTTQTGGSWVSTPPAWSNGKYIWTRSLITYTTGTPATSTTEPLVSSEWEAVNDIQVGGVNIVLEGWKSISTSQYMVAEYFIDEDFVYGKTYTVVFKGSKLSTQRFGLWQNKGSQFRGDFVEVEPNIWKLTFTSISTTSEDKRRIQIYQPNSGTAGPANIEWFKVVKGNKTSNDWQENLNDSYSGGDNLLKNSNFTKIFTGETFSVGGVSYNKYPVSWTGYNGGIGNPTTNYHAHIDDKTFNFPVVEFNETNGNRGWKAIVTGGIQKNKVALLKKNTHYNFSIDAYATGSGTKLFGGLYYTKVGGTQPGFHNGQFSIDINNINTWHRVNANLFLPSDADTSKHISFYIYGYDFKTNSILYVSNAKLSEGNKVSAWSLSPEDVKSDVDSKADGTSTEAALNEAAAKLQVLQQEVEAAATGDELKNFVKKYNEEQKALNEGKAKSEKSLSDAITSIDAIETNMGDMSQTWNFIDRSIRNTPQGIVIGNESSGSFIRINEQEIGFFSNGQRVAFVAQNLMQIDKGVFVEEIQVAKYQFEESTTNHLTIRYVG